MRLNNAWECACLVRWPKNLLHGEKKIMTLPFPSTLHPASLPQIKYKHQDSNKIHVFFTKSQEGVPEQYYLGTPDFLFPSHHKRLCVGDTYRLRPLGGRGVLHGLSLFSNPLLLSPVCCLTGLSSRASVWCSHPPFRNLYCSLP